MSMPGVVYLASWPRSGNTLLRAILWQCFGLESCSMYDENALFVNNPDWYKLTGAIPSPNRMKELQQIIDDQGVALFKTHETPETLADTPEDREVDDNTRTIYLIRDGREACVSYWHFLREIGGAPDTTLQDVIRGNCPFGSWSEHVRAWGCVNATKQIATLRYEDVRFDTNATAGMLRIFLGAWEAPPIAASTFVPWQDFQQSDPLFFRSGTNETWKTEMVGSDLALFDELHGDTMREYGYYPAKEPAYV